MDLKVEIAPAAAGQEAEIALTVPDDADLRIQLLDNGMNSQKDKRNVKQPTIRNVAKGEYQLIVQDMRRKYCSEIRQVTVN